MDSQDIKNVLQASEDVLKENKVLVNMALIGLVRELLNELRQKPTVMADLHTSLAVKASTMPGVVGEFSIDTVLDTINSMLNIEERLIGKTGDTLIKICENLKNRKLVLAMIARFM